MTGFSKLVKNASQRIGVKIRSNNVKKIIKSLIESLSLVDIANYVVTYTFQSFIRIILWDSFGTIVQIGIFLLNNYEKKFNTRESDLRSIKSLK